MEQKSSERQQSEETTKQSRWGLREKTAWDWLELLMVPLALAAIGFWFTAQQDARQQVENQRAEAERELAEQRAQDEALQAYLDQMSNLLLERNLLETEVGDPVYTLAQARTSAVVQTFDADRNLIVTRFLTDTGLTGTEDTSISLLRGINLQGADLRVAYLTGADLREAYLGGANLSGANMQGADLSPAVLSDADLSGANMPRAKLSGATLYNADLSGAYHADDDLSSTQLDQADMSGANIKRADLGDATLDGANLSNADLSGATVTQAQLDQARSLEGATMPNGQKYEDWLKTREEDEERG